MTLVQGTGVRVLLEDDEVLKEVEKSIGCSNTPRTNTSSSSADLWCVAVSPSIVRQTLYHSWFAVMRAHTCLQAVRSPRGRHCSAGERRNLRLVRLQLGVRAPDGGVFVSGVLEFDEAEREAVDEDDDVGTTVVLPFDDGELVDGEPVVRVDVVEVDQFDEVARDASVGARIFDWHTFAQHFLESAIGLCERGCADAQDFAEGVFAGVVGDFRIECANDCAKASDEDDIREGIAFGVSLAWCEMRTVRVDVAKLR